MRSRKELEEFITQLQLDTEDAVLETASMLKERYDSTMDKVVDIIAAWYLRNDIDSLTKAQSSMDALMNELSQVMDPANEEYIEAMTEHFAKAFAFNLAYSQKALDLEETDEDEGILLFTILGLASIAWAEDGLTYAERMALRNEQLKNQIRQIILRNATIGAGTKKLLKDLLHEMDKSKYRGTGVLVDESNRVANEAVKHAAEKDFSGYRISEVLDAKTCRFCASMHGLEFKWDAYQEGISAPQFHPRCRGRIIPVGNIRGD